MLRSRSSHSNTTAGTDVTNSPASTIGRSDKSGHFKRKRIVRIRLVFLLCLLAVAVLLGTGAYYIVQRPENKLAEQQFDALARRALDLGKELALRRRVVVKSMAQIASSSHPDASMWPNVVIPAFQTITKDLIETSGTMEIAFYPMVMPEEIVPGEQSSFEDFAYDFLHNKRNPPFPNTTGVNQFGQGIWKAPEELYRHDENELIDYSNTLRVHDTDGETRNFESNYQVLFPEFQNSDTGRAALSLLMFNAHSTENKGKPLDEVIVCTEERKEVLHSGMDCGVVTGIWSHQRTVTIIQPIYPVNDPFELVGVIMSRVSWDLVIGKMFEDIMSAGTSGIVAVLEADEERYVWTVSGGQTTFVEDDFFAAEITDSSLSISQTLEGSLYSGVSGHSYTISLYPTNEFFSYYQSRNPVIAMVGALLIVLMTSMIFLTYDCTVRREFNEKQQLLNAKRMFMRYVSHEVRTPLNSVTIGLTLLEAEIARPVVESAEAETAIPLSQGDDDPVCIQPFSSWCDKKETLLQLTEDVRSSADAAVGVLTELLNYDRVVSSTLSLELCVFPLFPLIEKVSREFKLQMTTKRIAFELVNSTIEPGTNPSQNRFVLVVGDEARLSQVLRNLISNAMKFTPEDGSVTLELTRSINNARKPVMDRVKLKDGREVVFARSGELNLQVTDTGAGLTLDQRRKLFQDGTQFNAGELQNGGGSGLGLFISRGIVEQHGGSLTVESDGLQRGSTFTMKLPYYDNECILQDIESCFFGTSHFESCASDAVEAAPTFQSPESNSFLRVLVVDDIALNRKLLSRLIRSKGHTVLEAEDGKVATEMVRNSLRTEESFDSILMDYEMPVMKGPEACREIRSMGCDSFIVGVTGNLLAEDVNYFTQSGANVVLPKPVSLSNLEEVWVEHGVKGR